MYTGIMYSSIHIHRTQKLAQPRPGFLLGVHATLTSCLLRNGFQFSTRRADHDLSTEFLSSVDNLDPI